MSLRYKFGAWLTLWRRYKEGFQFYWQRRHDMRLPSLQAHEADFLPAALSLQSQPVSPAGRWVARVLMLLLTVLMAWAYFGHIDIIVTASGKIIPGQRTKTIASVEVASVRSLHVEEGQRVKAGDLLIELDSRASDSDHDKALGDHTLALLQVARSRALITAIDQGRAPHLEKVDNVPTQEWQDANLHLEGQWRDYSAKLQRFNDEIKHYEAGLPLVTQSAQNFAELAVNHDVSTQAWKDKEQARIDMLGQLDEARNQRASLTTETRKTAEDAMNDADRIVVSSAQDARRASVHSDLLKLTAPIDGTVQQLTVHTVGGVVPAAQALMQIVPAQGTVEIEAFMENKDIGFVQEGQAAAAKIDAFEYTKYGTIPAQVSHVSRDAIQDEKKGLIYSVIVALDRPTIRVEGREMPLSAGMSANVEIKTGTRRVIEYVLSPLIQHTEESLHER